MHEQNQVFQAIFHSYGAGIMYIVHDIYYFFLDYIVNIIYVVEIRASLVTQMVKNPTAMQET